MPTPPPDSPFFSQEPPDMTRGEFFEKYAKYIPDGLADDEPDDQADQSGAEGQ